MNATVSPASVVVRRVIAAPREVLFNAWLDAASLAAWLRPFDTIESKVTMDPVEGGAFGIVMRTPGGDVPHHGEFIVIDPHKRLVFTWISEHTYGKASLVTVDFLASGKSTEIVLTHEQLPEEKMQAHNGGWTSGLEKLAARYEA
ncbi:MAG: hypothetical protein A3E01_03920 [Gammaproteobacteria bacterium RIFCSPHIGHO2_12_FULL_63_22]|nr:MAG: hypothetical protein A3E01_03920 [Gammaproteobacteria bacterium RIFCSPHIGHO2_12_FULL_63_22]